MNFVAIRGATTVEENIFNDILGATKELILEIEKLNLINRENVVSIIFSCTKDIDQVYPAKAARELGYTNAGLMCFNEMNVENSLDKCIRVMVFCNSNIRQKNIKHIYLKGAKILRPDLLGN